MSETNDAKAPLSKVPAAEASTDLSSEIIESIERLPGDRVTCRRVSEHHYRCNWWAAADVSGYDNPGMTGLIVTTHRVRKSRFLNVIRSERGLTITEPPARSSR